MQDSDDYFGDDLELDATALAIIDAEETKYAATQASSLAGTRPAPSGNSPPPKRQRIGQGYAAKSAMRREPSIDDYEDLPDITVERNGSYSLFNTAGAAAPIPKPVTASSTANTRNPTIAVKHTTRDNAITRPGLGLPPGRQSSSSPRPIPSRTFSHPSANQTSSRQPFEIGAFQQRPSHLARTPVVLTAIPGPRVQDDALNAELAKLKARMDELSRINEETQKALREAQQARYAKEGEVTILRKTIEKTAQEHAADLAKLRSAKEAAEAQQVEIQKSMKEEMERLKTQFTFKQHELETSARKPPWSTRSKRIDRGQPLTPILVSSQMRAWNPGRADAGRSPAAIRTPTRSRIRVTSQDSPKSAQAMKHGPPPLSGTKQMLPGFVNSFTQSKGKEPAPQLFGRSDGSSAEDQAGFFSSHPSPPSSPTDGKGLPAGPLDVHMDSDDMEYTNDGGDGQDAVMGTAPTPTPAIGASQSEGPLIEEIEPPDWGYELQRIMFSHRARATATFTLQALIGVHLGDDATDITKASHHHACAAILRVLGSVPSDELLDDMLVAISGALLDLVEILTAVHASRALASLFNLLTVLICSLPSFISSLLMIGDGLPTPRALTVLCEAIRFHLDPSRSFDASHEDLLNELFIVLGLITLSTPDHLESSLMIFPRTPGVLDLLLDDRHPDWVLRHNTQLLVNLASRPRLFRYLLSFPGADAGDAGTPTDFSQLPHIERMCAYLTDSSRRGDMMAATRSCVLEFLALLSVAHEDARTILLQSHALIPSIIVFLTLLASMIWEEQEDMILNSTVAQSTARMLVQALNLLHYLVFASDPAFDLRQKLIQAAQLRPFNGLTHMFIVTLGRLSYADCPDWLEGDELEQGAETARELLDLVVEGPELDSVWAAFQPGDEDESFIDDEEQEARMLEANEI